MVPITVIKRNGHREIFNRSKLLHGLSRACEKTELTPSKLEAIVDELELSLQQSNSREITSSEIGELVLRHLKGLSEVAYVRFASVYRDFQDISEFAAEINKLASSRKSAVPER